MIGKNNGRLGFWTVMAAFVVAVSAWTVHASPASLLVEGGKGAVKAAERVGVKLGGKAAVKGGAEFAGAKAARAAAKAAAKASRQTASAVGKTVENIGAGKILAAGGATALVVGTHEMADGVQSACASSGKALEDNPDKAAMVIGGVTWPIGISIGLLVLLAAGMLFWMFFPGISALRARLAARTQKAAVVPRAGYTLVQVLFAVTACVALTIIGMWQCCARRSAPVAPAPAMRQSEAVKAAQAAKAARVAELKRRLESCREDYRNVLQRSYDEFERKIDSLVAEKFQPVYGHIPNVAARYGAFGRISHLVKVMVVDKFTDGNDTAADIESDLQSCFYPAIYSAYDSSMAACSQLALDFERARARYRNAVDELSVEFGEELDVDFDHTLEQSAEKIEAVNSKLLEAQAVAALSVVLEAVCVRATVETISKTLAKTVARQAGTMAASVGAACADGPLPIGDIIGAVATVGCTFWSVWDIYSATETIPAEFAASLREAAANSCRKAAELVHTRARDLLLAYAAG